MTKDQRTAIVTKLTHRMREEGSWAGETHIQKGVFFLQSLTRVPTEFDYLIYKHGPFSFELRDEITKWRADGLFELRMNPFPYGPSIVATDNAKRFWARFHRTLRAHEAAIEEVAKRLGNKGVTELEKLATALYVLNEDPSEEDQALADTLVDLKPHLSRAEAKAAIAAVRALFAQVQSESDTHQKPRSPR